MNKKMTVLALVLVVAVLWVVAPFMGISEIGTATAMETFEVGTEVLEYEETTGIVALVLAGAPLLLVVFGVVGVLCGTMKLAKTFAGICAAVLILGVVLCMIGIADAGFSADSALELFGWGYYVTLVLSLVIPFIPGKK